MKLQRAFFAVIALAFLVSIGSLVTGGDNQKAQVIAGTNSVGVTAPSVGTTVAPGQTLPMTCQVATAPGYQIRSLVYAWFQNNGADVGNFTVDQNGLPSDANPMPAGSFTRNVTIPSITPGSNFKLQCVAYFDNGGGSATQSILMNFVSAPAPIPGCTDPAATNYNPNATVSDGSCTYPSADTTPPTAPVPTVVSGNTSSALTLSWTPSVSTDTTHVLVYRNSGGTTSYLATPIATVPVGQTSYTAIGLLSSKSYKFKLKAKDGSGNISTAFSAVKTGTTLAVLMPANVVVESATSSTLKITWDPTYTNTFNYNVYANTGGTSQVNTTTPVGTVSTDPEDPTYCFQNGKFCFTHSGLTAGTTYKYRVKALDDANNASTLTTTKTGTTLTGTPATPSAPSGLSVTTAAASWTDASTNETSFTLERATNSTFTTGLTTISSTIAANATTTPISTSGLTAGATYYFRIKAVNAAGSSAWSNTASLVIPQTVTAAPTNFVVTATAPTTATASWTDASTNETGFTLERASNSTFTTGLVTISSTIAANSTTYSVTGLTAGTTYYFRVRANATAPSAWVNSQAVTTPLPPDTSAPVITNFSPQPTAPALAAGTTSTTINVTTNESATCRYSTSNTTAYSAMTLNMTVAGGTSHSVTVNNLANGTSYSYYVLCADTLGNTMPTATSQAITFSVATPAPSLSSISVVDTDNGILTDLQAGMQINIGAQGTGFDHKFSMQANPGVVAPTSVNFSLTGPAGFTAYTKCEIGTPFSLFGDTGGIYTPWPITPVNTQILGGYTLTVTPYTLTNCAGTSGTSLVNQFVLVNLDDSTPPTNPASLSATYRSASEMRLSWTGSTDASGINHYDVTRNPGTTVNVGTQTTYTDTTGLTAGGSYTYTVTAVDNVGNTSGVSNAMVSPTLSTNFASGNQVETNASTNVKVSADASGNAGTQAVGALGTINGGPVWYDSVHYWSVNFASGTDGWVNQNNLDIYVAPPVDIDPPTTNITPGNDIDNLVLPADTQSHTITVATNEAATCRWSTTNVTYANMPAGNAFTVATPTSHNYPFIGLTNGTSYTRYISCADAVGNASATKPRTFSVASTPPAGDPVVNTTCPATMPTLEYDARNAARLTVQLCAAVSESTTPKTITLKWASVSGRTVSGITIYRKTETGAWASVATPAASSTSWADSGVSAGTYYEYKVQLVTSEGTVYGYIASGIKVPQEAYRGRLILVVDNTKATGLTGAAPTSGALATQVTQLINELTADKWVVTPIYVSPTATPLSVRTLIKGFYDTDVADGNSTTNTKAVYLFGHVPVAGIGNVNPDGHGARAISSDLIYGEMTGTWTVGSVTLPGPVHGVSTGFTFPSTNTFNNPSPDSSELQVGRVDFANIPGLSGTENEKLTSYLTKATNFKKRMYVPSDSVYIRARTSFTATGMAAWSSTSSVVGPTNVTHDRNLNDTWLNWNQNYLFVHGYGFGQSTKAVSQPLLCVSSCATGNSLSGSTWGGVFNVLSSSYLAEWNDTDSLFRAVLADEGKALTMSYGNDNHFYFHAMGMGKTVGYSTLSSINNTTSLYTPRGMTGNWDDESNGNNPYAYMSLAGDPTLRAHYVSGPSNLSVSNNGGLTSFSWSAASDSPLGYNVYEIQTNLVRKVNSSIISGTSYASSDTYSANNKYMVTAVKVRAGNSGTYYNESLGAIGGGSGGQPLSDTTAPTATITAPTADQVLVVDTTSTTLAVSTDEAATCKWSTTDQAYSSMPNTFTVTGLVAHTTTLSSLANGTSYTRYVRCQDTSANTMATSVSVAFSVAAATPPPQGGGTVMGINGPVGPSLTSNPTACTNPSGGTIYYVDGTAGNDSNAGTSTGAAWKTIDKVNASMGSITAGKMVCFKRGNTYHGKLAISSSGTASAPIIFDAYGTGTAPVISGAIPVTGWTQHSGNIYKATVSTPFTTPKYLFINGEYATLARQPNTGFYTTSSTNGTSLTDSGNSWLSAQAAGSLTGAQLVSRRTPWSWSRKPITGNSGSTISVASLPYGTGVGSGWSTSDWGYLVQNKLSLLDAAGEWYFDSATNTVYLWAPGSVNPSTLNVELASYDRAISLSSGKTDLIIRNLVAEKTNEYAVYTSQNKRLILENLEIAKAESGIRHYTMNGNASADRNIIRDNHIHDMNLQGLYLQGGNNHWIVGNVVEDISTVEERLSDSSWAHFGVYMTDSGSNNIVERNIFRDIGYIGITGAGGGLITENLVERPLQILTDGGGIAFDYTNGMTISKNIVRDSYSNMSTMPLAPYIGYIPLAKGIYFGDKDIKNTTVDSNVIIDVESDGIWMDHSLSFTGNSVTNNIIYGFTRAGIGLSDYSIYTAFPANGCDPKTNSPCFVANFNDVVTDNKIYGLASDENPLYMLHVYSNGSGGITDFGTIDRNYYGNPYRATKVQQQKLFAGTTNNWTLAQWQASSSTDDDDNNSNSAIYTPTRLPEIFYNATKDNIYQSVNGCNADRTPITGTQTITPFTAIVVEYGNC